MPDNDKLEEDYLNDLLNSILTSEEMTDEDLQEFGPISEEPPIEGKGEEESLESNNENETIVPIEEELPIFLDSNEESQEESGSVSEEYLMNLFDDSLALDENSVTDTYEDGLEITEELLTESIDEQVEPDTITRSTDNKSTDVTDVKEYKSEVEPEQTLGVTENTAVEEDTKKKKGSFLSAIFGKFSKSKDEKKNDEKENEVEKEQNTNNEQNVVSESETKEEESPKKKAKKTKSKKGKGKKAGKDDGSEETDGVTKNKKDKKKGKKEKSKDKVKEKVVEKEEVIKVSFKGLLLIITFIIIVILFVKIGGNLFSYSQNMNKTREYFLDKNYNEAYNLISGLELKDSDEDLYNQLRTVMFVYQEYVSYENFIKMDMKPEALDSLIIGVANYDAYKETADELGVLPDFEYSLDLITSKLSEDYNISLEEARELTAIEDRTEYSNEIYAIANK